MEFKNKEHKIRELIERIGVVTDKDGFPPLAGRVLGYLMLAEPPHKTFDEIVEAMQASKSAISNTLKFLESQKMVDYITFAADRKRYFRLNAEAWPQVAREKIEFVRLMQTRLKEVISLRSNDYPGFNIALENIVLFYELLLEELPRIIEKWEKLRRPTKDPLAA